MYHKAGQYLKLIISSKDDRDDHINLYEKNILLFYILMFLIIFQYYDNNVMRKLVFSNAISAICYRIHRSRYLKYIRWP